MDSPRSPDGKLAPTTAKASMAPMTWRFFSTVLGSPKLPKKNKCFDNFWDDFGMICMPFLWWCLICQDFIDDFVLRFFQMNLFGMMFADFWYSPYPPVAESGNPLRHIEGRRGAIGLAAIGSSVTMEDMATRNTKVFRTSPFENKRKKVTVFVQLCSHLKRIHNFGFNHVHLHHRLLAAFGVIWVDANIQAHQGPSHEHLASRCTWMTKLTETALQKLQKLQKLQLGIAYDYVGAGT